MSSSPPSETGPRVIPVPLDPSYYVIKGASDVTAGDMLKAEYAVNGGYGVVDKALTAYYVPWGGVQDPPLADSTQAGLMAEGNGDPTYFYGGDNAVHPSTALRGTHWWVGVGNPGNVPGAMPGDFYIDENTGNYFQLITPVAAPTPPPQAVTAGFTELFFADDFDALDLGLGTPGHKWNGGLWYETVPPSSDFSASNSILTITATATSNTNLCTQHYDSTGGASGTPFLGGYFEARMYCTDWSAFWLYRWKQPYTSNPPVSPSDPTTWINEIDIIESDPGVNYANLAFCTLHKNTGGSGGVPDEGNGGATDQFPMPGGGKTVGEWHIYGVLWTQTAVTFFVDNIQIASFPPYPSTWQPVQLILSAQPGGVTGQSQSTVIPPITLVDWVRVWEPPGYVTPPV